MPSCPKGILISVIWSADEFSRFLFHLAKAGVMLTKNVVVPSSHSVSRADITRNSNVDNNIFEFAEPLWFETSDKKIRLLSS